MKAPRLLLPVGSLLLAWLAAGCTEPKEGQPCREGPARTCPNGYFCAQDERCYQIGHRAPSGPGAAEGDAAPDDGSASDTTVSSGGTSGTGGTGGAGSGTGGSGGGDSGAGGTGGTSGGGGTGGTGGTGAGGTGGSEDIPPCVLGSALVDHCRLR
jgi:hypothetical protein